MVTDSVIYIFDSFMLTPDSKFASERRVFYIQKGAGILDACAFSSPTRRKTASIVQDAFRAVSYTHLRRMEDSFWKESLRRSGGAPATWCAWKGVG